MDEASQRAALARTLMALCAAVLLIGPAPIASGDDEDTHDGEGSESASAFETYDDLLSRVADIVPAFAGVWVEEETDTVVLSLTDTRTTVALAARQALAQVFGALAFPQTGVRRVPADYSFSELRSWYDPLSPAALAEEGAVLSDIDEVRNRIVIGVEDPALHGPAIEAHILRLGVPREAVLIVQEDPIPGGSSLQDRHRPVRGGIQISYVAGGTQACTLGLVARRVSSGNLGIITNAHCSINWGGGADGTVYHQHLPNNRIGRETVDPPLFTGFPCPAGRRCRYSDANFARLDDAADGRPRGYIARPGSGTNWNGSRVYRIVGRDLGFIGTSVLKVGRTTGRTSGQITQTCASATPAGTDITYLCQYRASYLNQGGDSGSPVFVTYPYGDQFDVKILGLNFTGTGTTDGWFSTIYNIEGELGQMRPCPPEIGGSC